MSLFIYYLPAWASDSDKHKEIKYYSAQFYPSTYLPQLSREECCFIRHAVISCCFFFIVMSH